MEEDCRPCTLAAALGFALDLSKQENIGVESLDNILQNGYDNEEEVKKALQEFVEKIPEEKKTEARSISCFAFQEEEVCNMLLPLNK